MFKLSELAAHCDGTLMGKGDGSFDPKRVKIDSRSFAEGDIFVAIKGENFDGHDFIKDVESKARLVLSSQKKEHYGTQFLLVPDTSKALGHMAQFVREKLNPTLIAITGSNGKSTSKEMMAAVLGGQTVLKNVGNFNNHIGLPLSLMHLTQTHRFAVLEMGMNHFGEIDYLARIARPNYGVITSIGHAHLEFLGGLEGVAKAKGELLAHVNYAAIPAGQATLDKIMSSEGCRFSVEDACRGKCDIFLDKIENQSNTTVHISFDYFSESLAINLPFRERHNISNFLAVYGIARKLGMSHLQIASKISEFTPLPGRNQMITLANQSIIIHDAYNANPDSMLQAFNNFMSLDCRGKRYLVLGEMLEQGDASIKLHQQLGESVAALDVEKVFVLCQSEYGESIAKGAELAKNKIVSCPDHETIAQRLLAKITADDMILIKGSRGNQLEKVVAMLRAGMGD